MSNLPPPPPPPPPGGGRGQKRPGKPDKPAPKSKFTPEGGSNQTGEGEKKPGFPRWGWWIVGLVALGAMLGLEVALDA